MGGRGIIGHMREWCEMEPASGVRLRLAAEEDGISEIDLQPEGEPAGRHNDANLLLCEATRQLREYFAGERGRFELRLAARGTEFQRRVWRELERIPYGQTRSYGQIAAAVGAPRSVRAVGAANGRNPLPIVVPCHRVIGADGRLTGYGGGLPLKQLLLELEARYAFRFR